MAGAPEDSPTDLSQGRVQEVRKQWAVHEDGALAYQMQNEEITQHYGLNRFHRRMVREDIPVAKFVQTEEELRQQEERLRELEVLKIQAEEDAKLAKKISKHTKREDKNRRDHENRHRGVHGVRNHTEPEIRNNVDHEFETSTDHGVLNHTHPGVINHTHPGVINHTDLERNRTDHEIRIHTDHGMKTYKEYGIEKHGEHQIQDHQVRNHMNHEAGVCEEQVVRNVVDSQIKNSSHRDLRDPTFHDVRNRSDHDFRNHIDDGRNRTDHDVRNRTDHDVRNQADHNFKNRADHNVRNRSDQDVKNRAVYDVRHQTDHNVINQTDHNVRNRTDHDVRNRTDHDVRNCADDARSWTDHDVRNNTDDTRNRTDHEVLDDEELARQLQEKERRKYERHLERKKEKKLKKERQMLEAALARDIEEARLTVNPENGSDHISASMESLKLHGVGVTRITPAGRIEDNGDFSDFYKLPDEMDEMTRLEIQASQDEELARLLQEQEHKRTKANVDPDKLRRIELQDEQLARIIQEEEQLRLKKAKQKHQARKEARRLMSVESMPLGASANSLIQQKQTQECPPETPAAAVPAISSGHHRYRSNSYTKACDSPPSPAHSPARRHRASPLVGEDHEQARIPSHESVTAAVGADHKNQYYSRSLHDKQPSTSSSTSSPGPALSSSRRGLSTLETARQIAAGNPEGILAIQNSQRNTGDRRRGMEQDRFMRSQEMLDIERIPVHMSARRGSDPYRQVTDVRGDAPVYSQPYKPHGVLLGSELRQMQVADVHGCLTDESGSSSGSMSRLSRLHQIHQYHQQQPHVDSFSKDDVGPQQHPVPGGLAEFNIVAALDPTYQRRHPEACLLPETQIQSLVPFSRSLPQADGELEWDPNLRGSLRKTKALVHGWQDPPLAGSLGHENAIAGEPVMSSWQPVQGQRRRDPASRGKAQQKNCKQQ
ncbi:unnamed protein product [Candidula unifasciata]|uniref:Coiled-coil domain-containing protein n=1 Tax=Candidula unifasciata TaxID=100452 RepID=A0A8S3Z2K9_9EUPU|nr:unnamed protein product [Candidula unifasciata]